MKLIKYFAALVGVSFAFGPWACSPSTGSNKLGQTSGSGANGAGANGSGANGAGANGSGSTNGSGANNGAGAGFIGFDTGGGSGTQSTPDGACYGTASQPEQIYIDATVTDTITTYSPVAVFIMLDRSGSMVTGFPTGSAASWGNVTNALTSFVHDPSSQSLDVGLGFFPPLTGAGNCDGSDCGVPAVDIGPLSQTAPAIVSAMNNDAPQPLNFTPTECALRGMESACETYTKNSNGEQCIAVFITDGTPDQCDGNTTHLANIVAAGLTAGVKTFTLQLPGVTDPAFLDQLAQAGGTGQSINASTGSNADITNALITALDTIRAKTTTSETTHIKKTITKPLDCQWKIPAAPGSNTFDPQKVNMSYIDGPTNITTPLGHLTPSAGETAVNPATDCNIPTPQGDYGVWYYTPNDTAPTEIQVCPSTCTSLQASTTGTVSIDFGCKTNDILH